jgi:predicted permease
MRGRKPHEDSEELEVHLAQLIETYMDRGLSEKEARAAARRQFGNVTRVQEQSREMFSFPLVDNFLQDVLYALRALRRNPSFTLTAVLVLALGLGAATAVFSALDRILFRPLPYADADRLVSFGLLLPSPDGRPMPEAMLDTAYFRVWKPAPPPFVEVATMSGGGPCDLTEEPPLRLSCAAAEATLLRTLGVHVFAGRDFTADDDVRGAPRVVLLRYGLWQERFGGDRRVIGKTISLDGMSAMIVGILPPDFEFLERPADILYPQRVGPVPQDQQFMRFMNAVGRLKPGVTPGQAEAAVQRLLPESLESFRGRPPKNAQLRVRPLQDRLMGDATRSAWLLLGAVGTLLLIACVNLANLMLARIATRQREFAVRSALGAGKLRLARLALAESLLLAFAAGALGLAVAAGLLKVFVALAPASIPKIGQASLDLRVLAVAVALAAITGTAAGIWPALSILSTGEVHGARTTTGAPPRVRFLLVTVQIAFTMTLLGGSGLLLRSLWNQVSIPLGFQTKNVLHLQTALNVARYSTPEQQARFFADLLTKIRELPGTIAAAYDNSLSPLGIAMTTPPPLLEGQARDPNARGPLTRNRVVSTQYFETYRIAIVRGRAFIEEDRNAEEFPAVINESLERLLFGDASGLGKRLRVSAGAPWHTVVGVAADVRNNGFLGEMQPEIYVLPQGNGNAEGGRFGYFAIRTMASMADGKAVLERAVADLDPLLPVSITPADASVSALTERPRFVAWLLSAFAGFALLLAAVGLYGVASYLVTQRTRDIGVRMALGASSADISQQVIGEAGRWIVAGAVVGCALAWFVTRALQGQLYEVSSHDPFSWIAALSVLSAALVLAVLRPAARAARTDPVVALRAD